MDYAVIAFQGKDVICPLLYDLRCDLGLTAHRINGHNTAFDRQNIKQFRNRRNLVGFLSGLHLPQYQMILSCPGADHVDCGFISGPIIRTA